MDSIFYRAFKAWHPKEGWLPLVLILAIGSTVVTAVLEVDWVPEAGVVAWTVAICLPLTILLAKRSIAWPLAALLIIGYGICVTIIFLAQPLPPLQTLSTGIDESAAFIRQNLFLFGDRIGGWFEAVAAGESSEETIVFAIGLGVVSCLLVAYAGWATYRQKNPLNGLMIMGAALAFNAFYGNGEIWTLVVYICLAVLLTAVIHMTDLQQYWELRQIDYPTDIKFELVLTAGAVALSLMAFSLVLPAISIRSITRAFVEQPVVQEAEQSLERAFAGVNVNDENLLGQNLERGASSSGLPRSFLLGNPPELAETLVMTATIQGLVANGSLWPHWRAFTYDVYNGWGWSVSSEREEPVPAGTRIALPPVNSPRILTQSVFWQLNRTNTRYSMGLPLRFDHDVTAHWRGLSDLSQVTGSARNYTAESQFSNATPADLRQTVVGDISETILARYTVLPADIPDRVIQLAREAALADNETPPSMYDQVQAIEQFLRQYPYSLDLPTPPRNQDLVDYFLFDLQTGYCDYYATSMVVMARSLGFPARFATGFLAQPPDENGVQHIYQLNAHSWAEIYFAGYGWIEFEPTAPFPTQSESDGFPAFQPSEPPEFALTEPMALPPATVPNPGSVLTNSYFLVIFFLFLVAVGTMAWFMRGKRETQDSVLSAYGRLLRSANAIGSATPESQTPIEFEATFKNRLGQMTAASKLAGSLIQKRPNQENESGLPDAAAQLTDLFIAHQYRPPDGFNGDDLGLKARLIWRRIRLRLWLLTLLNKLRRVVGK